MAEKTVTVEGGDEVKDGLPVAYLRVPAHKDFQETDMPISEGVCVCVRVYTCVCVCVCV